MTWTDTTEQSPILERDLARAGERAGDPIFAQVGSEKKFHNTEHQCLAVGMNSMFISPRVSLDGQGMCKYRTVFDCCRVDPPLVGQHLTGRGHLFQRLERCSQDPWCSRGPSALQPLHNHRITEGAGPPWSFRPGRFQEFSESSHEISASNDVQ